MVLYMILYKDAFDLFIAHTNNKKEISNEMKEGWYYFFHTVQILFFRVFDLMVDLLVAMV